MVVFLMPLEVLGHAVPNLKADIRGKLEPSGLRFGGTLILCCLLSQIAHLVHNEGLGWFGSLGSVFLFRTERVFTVCMVRSPSTSRGAKTYLRCGYFLVCTNYDLCCN